jgi:hypothetical protein
MRYWHTPHFAQINNEPSVDIKNLTCYLSRAIILFTRCAASGVIAVEIGGSEMTARVGSDPPNSKFLSSFSEQELLDLSKLIRVVLGALVDNQLENASASLKAEEVPSAKRSEKAQVALINSMKPLLSLLQNPIDKHFEALEEASKTLTDGLEKISSVVSDLREKMSNERLEEFLHPSHKFLQTLAENRDEKTVLAKRLCTNYFLKKDFRCFVQGSSLAYLLGREISTTDTPGVLIHTNSTVMHFPVLRERSKQFVYTFCGGVYDPICASWLFGAQDSATSDRLAELFTRQHDPLEMLERTTVEDGQQG